MTFRANIGWPFEKKSESHVKTGKNPGSLDDVEEKYLEGRKSFNSLDVSKNICGQSSISIT